MLGILAKKVGMTIAFDESGNAIVVTVLEVLENVITQIKQNEGKDGYNAIQIGALETSKEEKLSKAELGHFKKNSLKFFRLLKEFRVSEDFVSKYTLGQEIDPTEVLGESGSLVDATARPIGRGTSGRIKRWNQHRRRMTHGTKHHRQIGSAGAGTTPGRVLKGKKMPGRDKNLTTISHLKLFKYDPENKMLLIAGAVPGHKDAIIQIKASKPAKGWNKYALQIGKRLAA